MTGRLPDRRRFPRTARVNEVLREVIADELERRADVDERLRLVTVTAVEVEPDLRHATVYLSSLSPSAEQALSDARVRLQSAIGRQARLKRTPLLAFVEDPGVRAGERIEEILRRLHHERRADGGAGPEPRVGDGGEPGGTGP